jgi:hypothetical protein
VRGGMTGMVQGRHRSRGAGSSTEFYEFRPYTIGDDAGRIDWKVYARSDRLYLRRFAAETRQTVGEVVDCSASMLFRGLGENSKGRSSKLEVASAMATALGLITLRSGDRVAGVMAEAKRLVGRVEVPALSGIGSLSELASGIASGGQIPMQRLRKDEQGDGLGLALEAAGRLSAARGAGGSARTRGHDPRTRCGEGGVRGRAARDRARSGADSRGNRRSPAEHAPVCGRRAAPRARGGLGACEHEGLARCVPLSDAVAPRCPASGRSRAGGPLRGAPHR